MDRKKRQYIPKSYESFWGNVKVELYLSSYATKAYLKITTVFDASKLAAKCDVASSKAEEIW